MVRTEVTLVDLDDQTIATYVAIGESFDKAGAYGIQGVASRFVDRINGSYTNVVGLPMNLVERLMKKLDESA
jgi:septum formation protein